MNPIFAFDNGRSTSTIDQLFSNYASQCSQTKVILTNHRYTDHNAIFSKIIFPTGIVIQRGHKLKWKRFHGDESIQKHFQAKLYSLYHDTSSEHNLQDMHDTLQTVTTFNTNIDNNDIMHRIFIRITAKYNIALNESITMYCAKLQHKGIFKTIYARICMSI